MGKCASRRAVLFKIIYLKSLPQVTFLALQKRTTYNHYIAKTSVMSYIKNNEYPDFQIMYNLPDTKPNTSHSSFLNMDYSFCFLKGRNYNEYQYWAQISNFYSFKYCMYY